MYKKDQGKASRIGALAIGLLLAFYGSSRWYYHFMPSGTTLGERFLSFGAIGALLVFVAFVAAAFHFAFRHAKSSDFLIEMDLELRKVIWPSATPLFDPKAEAWGSTYVVIVCTAMFTVYIWLADMFLDLAINKVLFGMILFPAS